MIPTIFLGCDVIFTTVVSINCKLGFLLDDIIKSSVRISSTRFSSPVDSSINEPLLKFATPLLVKFLFLLLALLLLVLLLMPLLLPERDDDLNIEKKQ